MEKVIETERLILRKPTLSDTDSLFPLLSDKYVEKYTPGLYCAKRKNVISYLKIISRYNYFTDICFVIEHKYSKKIIGLIEGYTTSDNVFPVSYVCLASERNKGYITEATKSFISYIYNNCDFKKILFYIATNNVASQKVMKKLSISLTNENYSYKEYTVSLKEELPF